MTLLIKEAEVQSLLTMPVALEVVENSLRQQGEGELIVHPRRRVRLQTTEICTTWRQPIPRAGTWE